MKNILITGANSYIGTSFENYVKENFSNEYSIDTVDMIDATWREKDFSEYDTVFHVAGIAHQKETDANAKLYYEINCDLAVETAKKAKNDGVKQFVFLSSMSVYGIDEGIITKDTELCPKSNYGKSKLMAEDEIAKLCDENFLVAVVRPPMVYGPKCRGNFNSLVKFANKLPAFPKVNNQRSMIFIDNLSEFVRIIIEKQLSGLYMPQNKEYINTCDMARWILEKQGKKIHESRILALGLKIIMPFVGMAKKAFGTLAYHHDLEALGFEYCIVDSEASVKKSIVSEENTCER